MNFYVQCTASAQQLENAYGNIRTAFIHKQVASLA